MRAFIAWCVLLILVSLTGCRSKTDPGCYKDDRIEDCRALCSDGAEKACGKLHRLLVTACTRRADLAACKETCKDGKPRVACAAQKKLEASR